MHMVDCPFCHLIHTRAIIRDVDLAVAIADAFPLNPGHALIVARRHEPDFLALTPGETHAVWALARDVCARLATEYRPDGFTLGVNVGAAGGQTVAHAHLHVIPRFEGNVEEPRGGIRWIIPARAAYWRGRDPC
jgi:diadenosine tetraphosphate (Ap4A) HIT family hydrolase